MQRTITASVVLLVACGEPATTGIGADGGQITLGELSLDIPAGALEQDTEITIRRDEAIEVELPGLTDVFAIEPIGLQLAIPAEVHFELSAAPEAEVKWSPDGDAWAVLSSTPEAEVLSAQLDQLGWVYVTEMIAE